MKLTRRNYHSKKANLEYFSVSQFKAFQKCSAAAIAELNGEYEREKTTSLLIGSYVDSVFDGTVDTFEQENPEIFKRDGTLKSEYIQANAIIERMKKDKLMMRYMSGKKQVIMTGEICGVPVKIMMDSFHPGKMIVDRKIMANFDSQYDSEKGRVAWFEYWGYDLQGAVYQEVVYQNTGERLPFYLAAATKQNPPDIDIIQIEQDVLDFELERFKQYAEQYDAIKRGVIEPERCEQCPYCRASKVLTEPHSSSDFYEF